jgi:serine protease Do
LIINMKKQTDSDQQRSAVIPAVILSAFFGLAAGMVGMLVMIAFFPTLTITGYPTATSLVNPLVQSQAGRATADFAIKEISASTALIFKAEDVGEVTLVTKAVGLGVVITSDGWLMTHNSVLTKSGRLSGKGVVAVIGGEAHAVLQVVTDSYSDISFLKVDGSGLPVAAFAQGRLLSAGDSIYAFGMTRDLRQITVVDINGLPANSIESAIRSSEDIQKVIRLSGVSGLLPGSAMMNHFGEVAGIYVGESVDGGSYAVPIEAVYRKIGNVLRGGEIIRPYLGVRFIDLSEYPNEDGMSSGAKLKTNGRLSSAAYGSPAAKAGLRDGDVIQAVNGERITANK